MNSTLAALPSYIRNWGLQPHNWLMVAVCFGLPAFIMLTIPAPLIQAGFLDPDLYAGLIHDYGQLIDRFDATYYATRVAFIAPAALLENLFGWENGYLLTRFLLLSLLCSSVYFFVRDWFGAGAAAFFAAIAAFGPWLLRSISWDYTSGVAVIYMIAAIALATDKKNTRWRAVAAGAMFACAVNVGANNLAFGGAFLFSWMYLLRLDVKSALPKAAMILAGFIGAYAIMSIALFLAYPIMGPFVEITTIRIASNFMGAWGSGQGAFYPLSAALRSGHYISLLPFVTLAWLGVLLIFKSARIPSFPDARRFQWAAFTHLAIVCFGFFLLHFYFRVGTLVIQWSVIFAFPATFFAWVAILGPSLLNLSTVRRRALLGGAGVILTLLYLNSGHVFLTLLPNWDSLDPFLAVAIGAIVVTAIVVPIRAYAMALLVLVAAHVPHRDESGFYTQMFDRSTHAREADVAAGGRALMDIAGQYAPPEQGSMAIWHPAPAPRYYMALTSYLFYGYSFVGPSGGDLPRLNESVEDRVRNLAFLILVAPTEDVVEQGLSTLTERNINHEVTSEGQWKGAGGWGFAYAVVAIGQTTKSQTDTFDRPIK